MGRHRDSHYTHRNIILYTGTYKITCKYIYIHIYIYIYMRQHLYTHIYAYSYIQDQTVHRNTLNYRYIDTQRDYCNTEIPTNT